MPRSTIDYFIMDAIAFDHETFDEILAYLNEPDSEWRNRFERLIQSFEVEASLMRLVHEAAVDVLVYDEAQQDYVSAGPGVWPKCLRAEMNFDLTGRGRVLYINWED